MTSEPLAWYLVSGLILIILAVLSYLLKNAYNGLTNAIEDINDTLKNINDFLSEQKVINLQRNKEIDSIKTDIQNHHIRLRDIDKNLVELNVIHTACPNNPYNKE